ncbi:beta-glucosidase [Aspergillus bertholletiae]|uniref:Beta-glucosidase n=1 Tax=Aspergillus bertholletiae TaxID=1226010 RepID=A0A5N7AVX3_9EURO|nr:beta-glucosidase [Aspergillus bertholletiae]
MAWNPSSRVDLSTQACDICRRRKVKCHRTQGRCSRCERLNLSCTFLSPSKVRGPKKRLRTELESVSRSLSQEDLVHHTDRSASQHLKYPTDDLWERTSFKLIMEDYIVHLYPLLPVVHLPSFRRALREDRDRDDSGFLGLVFAIAAVVVATLPSRFQHYCSLSLPLQFQSRREMVSYCADRIMGLRTATYFDEINFQKFAVSYLLYAAFLQLGDHNRSRMLNVEAMQIARLLNLHCISQYNDLNCIETQLRKKGFWLIFYTLVHARLQNMLGERLSYLDPALLQTINPDDMMPLEVDDEFILENEILTPRARTPCLVTGFIIHSRVFWAAVSDPLPGRSAEEPCPCVRARDSHIQISYLQNRLQNLKYLLHDIPAVLRPWGPPNEDNLNDDSSAAILRSNFETMRANLHVTHLWLQSLLIDQLEAAQSGQRGAQLALRSGHSSYKTDSKSLWLEREELCRQLFFVLHTLPQASLEANGLHLAYKVRDIAASILTCPFHPQEPEAKRAAEYVQDATSWLSRLDRSESINALHLQSWVDTDRVQSETTIP